MTTDGSYLTWGSNPVCGDGAAGWSIPTDWGEVLTPAKIGVTYRVLQVGIGAAGLTASGIAEGRLVVYFSGGPAAPILSIPFAVTGRADVPFIVWTIPGGRPSPYPGGAVCAAVEASGLIGGTIRARALVEEH